MGPMSNSSKAVGVIGDVNLILPHAQQKDGASQGNLCPPQKRHEGTNGKTLTSALSLSIDTGKSS